MVNLPVIPKPVDATSPSTTGTSPSGGTNSNLGFGGTQLNTQDFISILTAQLQYQDPLNPLDPNQFVGEMAQFSSLNELIGIKQDLDQVLRKEIEAMGVTKIYSPEDGRAMGLQGMINDLLEHAVSPFPAAEG